VPRTTHVFEGIETLIEYGGAYDGSGDATHGGGPDLKDEPDYRERILGDDLAPARRRSLFQLVYHGSVPCAPLEPSPGRAPELWSRHDLLNSLYGNAHASVSASPGRQRRWHSDLGGGPGPVLAGVPQCLRLA